MKKVLNIFTLLLVPLIWSVGFATGTLDKSFTVSIMDNNTEVCKVTFDTTNDKLTTSVNGNGEKPCKVEGDAESGFKVILHPSSVPENNGEDK